MYMPFSNLYFWPKMRVRRWSRIEIMEAVENIMEKENVTSKQPFYV